MGPNNHSTSHPTKQSQNNSRWHETAKQKLSSITVNFRGFSLFDESLQVHKIVSCGWVMMYVASQTKQPAKHFLCQLKKLALNLPLDQNEFQSIVFDSPRKWTQKIV